MNAIDTEHALQTTVSPIDRFVLRQKHTMAVNRYTIHPIDVEGGEERAIAFAQQKFLALRERVSFYADEERTRLLFGFLARDALELGTSYDPSTPATSRSAGSRRSSASRSRARPGAWASRHSAWRRSGPSAAGASRF